MCWIAGCCVLDPVDGLYGFLEMLSAHRNGHWGDFERANRDLLISSDSCV